MDFDEVLDEIGHFGKYQKKKYVVVSMFTIFGAMIMLASNYIDAVPGHRCFIEACDVDGEKFSSNCSKRFIPLEPGEDGLRLSGCKMFLAKNLTIWKNKTVSCDRWVYDESIYKNTTVTQWDLVCGRNSLHALSQAAFLVGILFGSIIFGSLGDRIGRRPTYLIALILLAVVAILNSFAPLLPLYIAGRLIMGAANQGVYLSSYVLAVELVGGSKRVLAGTGVAIIFAVGYFTLAPLAYLLRDWHYLHLATAIPVIFFVTLYWYLPESVRWLLSQKRYSEAEKIVLEAAEENGVVLTAPVFAVEGVGGGNSSSGCAVESESSITMFDALREPVILCRSLNIFYLWIVLSLVYYGLSLNVSSLGGDPYLDLVLMGGVEMIGYAISVPILNRYGRKYPLLVFFFLCGVCLISTAFIQKEHWLQTVLSLFGKLCICGAFADVYIYTGELYPTIIRNGALGISSMFSRVGAISAPYVNLSGDYLAYLPNLVFGCTSVLAAMLAILLPETQNQPLPETLSEAVNVGQASAGYQRLLVQDCDATDPTDRDYKEK